MQKEIKSWEDLESEVKRIGMLPYFTNKIPGFSVEERVPDPILWDMEDGPWEWKGKIVRNFNVAYGKIFGRRAGYISTECLPDFMKVRRINSMISAESEEGRIYKILKEHESLLSKELKTLAGYTQGRKPRRSANPFENMPVLDKNPEKTVNMSDSRFESAITRLQMAGYVVIADFEYLYDRQGNRYGWGIARYTTPEALYNICPSESPWQKSYQRLFERLRKEMPDVDPKLIHRIIL